MNGLVLFSGSDSHYQGDKITELYKKRLNHIYYKEKSTDKLFASIKELKSFT